MTSWPGPESPTTKSFDALQAESVLGRRAQAGVVNIIDFPGIRKCSQSGASSSKVKAEPVTKVKAEPVELSRVKQEPMKKQRNRFQQNNKFGKLGAQKRKKAQRFNARSLLPSVKAWYLDLMDWVKRVRLAIAAGQEPPTPDYGNFLSPSSCSNSKKGHTSVSCRVPNPSSSSQSKKNRSVTELRYLFLLKSAFAEICFCCNLFPDAIQRHALKSVPRHEKKVPGMSLSPGLSAKS